MTFRRLMYLLSGCSRVILAAALLGFACAQAAVFRRDSDAIAGPAGKTGQLLGLIGAFVNFVLLTIAGAADLSIWTATPNDWITDPDADFDKYKGALGSSFFTSGFADRHQIQTTLNRVIATVSLIVTFTMGWPISQWRSSECLQPLAKAGETCMAAAGLRFTYALFSIQFAGVVTSHLTMHLWQSLSFSTYSMMAFTRMVMGSIILGIASRYISGISSFSQGQDQDYNVLPPEIKSQVSLLFELLLTNGLASGVFALAGGWVSLVVVWRRNKVWIAYDAVLICAGVFILLASFVSTYWLQATHRFFCRYAADPLLFPVVEPASHSFGDDVCQAIRFHYQMNYQYWITFASVIVSLIQLVHALLMISIYEPMEWKVAQRMLLMEIKQRHGRWNLNELSIF